MTKQFTHPFVVLISAATDQQAFVQRGIHQLSLGYVMVETIPNLRALQLNAYFLFIKCADCRSAVVSVPVPNYALASGFQDDVAPV